jgi:hypothetical protein
LFQIKIYNIKITFNDSEHNCMGGLMPKVTSNDNVTKGYENNTPRDKSKDKEYDTQQDGVLRDRPDADYEAADRKKEEMTNSNKENDWKVDDVKDNASDINKRDYVDNENKNNE